MARVPKWWGVIIRHAGSRRTIKFETWRPAEPNLRVDALSVARLLWKSEAAAILSKLGEPGSFLRQPRAKLYERLADSLELAQLQRRVRNCLRNRKNWRGLELPSPDGD